MNIIYLFDCKKYLLIIKKIFEYKKYLLNIKI